MTNLKSVIAILESAESFLEENASHLTREHLEKMSFSEIELYEAQVNDEWDEIYPVACYFTKLYDEAVSLFSNDEHTASNIPKFIDIDALRELSRRFSDAEDRLYELDNLLVKVGSKIQQSEQRRSH